MGSSESFVNDYTTLSNPQINRMVSQTQRRALLTKWQRAARLNNTQVAALMDVHRVTYSRWVHKRQPIPKWVVYWVEHIAPGLPLST